jgi:hypothetical protein
MIIHRRRLTLLFLATCGATAALAACNTETATTSVIENTYPAIDAGVGAVVVYKAWWLTTYFADAVPPGGTSDLRRSVPGSDFAYAVLAPGWDPTSSTPPTTLVAVRSKAPVSASRGEEFHIQVNDATFAGNCGADQALSQEDADFITQRIFPGEFDGKLYDAKTCTLSTPASDAGDASTDGS